jgi:hypothetical protein
MIDLGDQVVVLADMPMRAQASGISLSETYACVSTLKDGKVIRQRDFLDHAEALKAVGLHEESDHLRSTAPKGSVSMTRGHRVPGHGISRPVSTN